LTKFIVDEMHGHIVRWLRILGFDTLDACDLRKNYVDVDRAILMVAMKENRVIVTSDKQLAARAKRMGLKVVMIEANLDHVGALRKILEELNIVDEAKQKLFSRCPMCNGILVKTNKESVKDKVPSAVLRFHDEFWVCTSCGKVYWVGSHFKNIRRVLSRIL